AALHKSIAIEPGNGEVHLALSDVLMHLGQIDEDAAITRLRKDVADHPNDAMRLVTLASALSSDRKKQDAAIVLLREAMTLDPGNPIAHCILGYGLMEKGSFGEALPHLIKGDEIGSKSSGWPIPSGLWVQECQQLIDLESKFTAFLKGQTQPKDTGEIRAYAR